MRDDQLAGMCSLGRRDVAALIGVCAVLEGHLMGDPDRDSHLSQRLGSRLANDGVSNVDPDARAVRQALNDLNHRLRYALGEYPDPPRPLPVPA